MVTREVIDKMKQRLKAFAALGIIGPRQIGKTTLALKIGEQVPSQYLDLEDPLDLAKLDDPSNFFAKNASQLLILDEIQRKPDLFPILRGVIDKRRRQGQRYGQFLILGSASVKLLRQSSESLSGRITYEEVSPITALEYSDDIDQLWLRGGYPESLLATDDTNSLMWRHSFISTYLERDIPFFSPRVPSTAIRRLWTMLAHNHGQLLNMSVLASSLGISTSSVARYIDLMESLFLIRKLRPWYQNTGKRITKSPKVYINDSGILHSLLNIKDYNSLYSHPISGPSWEGFVLQNILGVLPDFAETYFYRTSGGAEIDMIITLGDKKIAVEVKKASVPKLERGFYEACQDLHPDEKYLIYTGQDSFYMKHDVLALSLPEFLTIISAKAN